MTFNESDTNWTSEQLAGAIGDYDGLITCWGYPLITEEVLDAAPKLKVIAHSAGSVKGVTGERAGARDQGVLGLDRDGPGRGRILADPHLP